MVSENLLHKLYCNQKLSMVEVADKLRTTSKTIEYWLKKYNIPRRSWSESAYAKQNPNGDPFKLKKSLTGRDKELLVAGLMLFWGEGSSYGKHSIQLGNLDANLIRIFIKFLRRICGVEERKLALYVRLYEDFSQKEAQKYWSELLSLPKEQVRIYAHNDPRSNPNKQKSKYGIATLQFCNMRLRGWLDKELEKFVYRHMK